MKKEFTEDELNFISDCIKYRLERDDELRSSENDGDEEFLDTLLEKLERTE